MTAIYDDVTVSECAVGTRCGEARSVRDDDGNWTRVPAVGPRPICGTDSAHVHRVVLELPTRFVTLWTHLGKRQKPTGGGGAPPGKSGSQVPLNLVVDALMREIIEVSVSWEERVRDVACLSPRRHGVRAHLALANASTLLSAHHEALLALGPAYLYRSRDLVDRRRLPEGTVVVSHSKVAGWAGYRVPMDGTGAALEFLSLAHRIRSVLRETRQPQHLEVRCTTCGRQTLERHDGHAGLDDDAVCKTCGEVYGPARYALALREQHDEAVIRKRARGRRQRRDVSCETTADEAAQQTT